MMVAGTLCSRSFWSGPELAKLLAPRFTVYNYDRWGRGDSGDTEPYAVEREVKDIKALIDEAGGAASLYGHSYPPLLMTPPPPLPNMPPSPPHLQPPKPSPPSL